MQAFLNTLLSMTAPNANTELKQQERVWKQERSAIDERKRVQQLLKEQAEERQIQEMQRMGGKVDDRVEWLYNAAGSSGQQAQNEDMEAYLLGKKSVEGLFKKRDEEKVSTRFFPLCVCMCVCG